MATKAALAEKQRAYYQRHKAATNERVRVYRERYKDAYTAYQSAYREHRRTTYRESPDMREQRLAAGRAWYQEHREEIAVKGRAYRRLPHVRERRRAYNLRPDVLARRREKAHVERQARRAKARGVRIRPRDIYERDAWRCGVCHRRIDPRLRWPDLKSASLDHIMPLAQGGKHVLANLQAAHLYCNSRKTDRGPGQLRLIS